MMSMGVTRAAAMAARDVRGPLRYMNIGQVGGFLLSDITVWVLRPYGGIIYTCCFSFLSLGIGAHFALGPHEC